MPRRGSGQAHWAGPGARFYQLPAGSLHREARLRRVGLLAAGKVSLWDRFSLSDMLARRAFSDCREVTVYPSKSERQMCTARLASPS